MKVVYRTENLAMAYLVRDLLGQHGIAAEVGNESLAQLWGGAQHPASTLPMVWIADEARAQEAKALIRDCRQLPGASWICPSCSEPCDGVFTECWNCGAERPPPS